MKEVWKDVVFECNNQKYDFSGKYLISNTGRIKTVKNGYIHSDNLSYKKYATCGLYLNKRVKTFYVHRIVYQVFIGSIPKHMEVNHINCIRNDNRLENLEVLTHKDNIRHSVKKGNYPSKKGGTNPKAKQVYMIEKKSNKIIKEFSCAKEASDYLNKPYGNINHVCRNEQGTAYGYKWEYVN